jgi:hypothetical protein
VAVKLAARAEALVRLAAHAVKLEVHVAGKVDQTEHADVAEVTQMVKAPKVVKDQNVLSESVALGTLFDSRF